MALTSDDIAKIQEVVKMEVRLGTEDLREKVERIELLPTKDEFLTAMSEVMGDFKPHVTSIPC